MCDCDCIQNPYYQDLVVQKACYSKGLPAINVDVYPETRRCAPCQNRDNFQACGFPTWGQFDKLDCTFKGLNRTYGKLVPARMMSDVMIPGAKILRPKKSASESRLKRVPCKKKYGAGAGAGGGRGSDTHIGGKSKNGGAKGNHPGKNGKGGHKAGGGNGGNGGKSSKNKGSKKGDHGKKGKGGDHSKDSSPDGETDISDSDRPCTDNDNENEACHGIGQDTLGEDDDNVFTQSLMNSGILTLTPLQERNGQYYFNFNIRNQKPNPDLNLDINVQDEIFVGDNKLTTEIRYRLEHTFDEAI